MILSKSMEFILYILLTSYLENNVTLFGKQNLSKTKAYNKLYLIIWLIICFLIYRFPNYTERTIFLYNCNKK